MLSGIRIKKQFYLTEDGTVTGTTIPCQSGPGSNSNQVVLHIPLRSSTEALTTDPVYSDTH